MTPPIPPGERLSEAEREALERVERRLREREIGMGGLSSYPRDQLTLCAALRRLEEANALLLMTNGQLRALLAAPSDSGGEGLADARARMFAAAVEASPATQHDRGEWFRLLGAVFNYEHACRAATPPTAATPTEKFPVPDVPGNWPEDAGLENGDYQCVCHNCRRVFYGHKRRVTCKLCAATPSAGDAGAKLREALEYFDDEFLAELSGTLPWTADNARTLRDYALTRPQGAATLAVDAYQPHGMEREHYKLLHGFMLDCNAVGAEQAGRNLARGIKESVAALNTSQAGGAT